MFWARHRYKSSPGWSGAGQPGSAQRTSSLYAGLTGEVRPTGTFRVLEDAIALSRTRDRFQQVW
jgi:hypothetical protein